MITQLRAYELAHIICESYFLKSISITVHSMITNRRDKKPDFLCSIHSSAIVGNIRSIRPESGLVSNYELAVRQFELTVAKETQTDYQRCAEFYLYEDE